MYCSKCGALNQDGSKFCSNCSSPLNIVASPPQQPIQQPVQQPIQQYVQKPQNSPRKSILVPALVGIIALIVVLIVIFFVWAALSPDSDAAATVTKTSTAAAATTTAAAPATTATTTQAAQTATQTAARTETAATTFVPDPEIIYADSPENAVWMVQLMMNDTGYEFYREEFFIDNGDGTLSIDINTPEAADTLCYIVAPNGSDGNYFNCFMVKAGTTEIYTMTSEDTAILSRIN
ncbi:MAG: zinc-ribbon domain-containing protein [Eubacteriales bacterium]